MDKELLNYLSAILPHKVYVKVPEHISINPLRVYSIQQVYKSNFNLKRNTWVCCFWNGTFAKIDEVKPYLRPMSSMTEEEKNYIDHRWGADNYGNITTYSSYEGGVSEIELADIVGFQDWLNKNMFDYRGLIEKNLALDCTGLHIYD